MYKNIKGVCRPDFVCEAKEMSREGTEDFPLLRTYLRLQKVVLSSIDRKHFKHTRTQFTILMVLAHREPVYMSQIAEYISSSNEQATRAVAPLVNEGLVERHTDPGNRKLVYIRLSGKGREYINGVMSDIYTAVQENIRKALGEEELDRLRSSLRAAAEVLGKLV